MTGSTPVPSTNSGQACWCVKLQRASLIAYPFGNQKFGINLHLLDKSTHDDGKGWA